MAGATPDRVRRDRGAALLRHRYVSRSYPGQYSGGYTTVSVISLGIMVLAGPALYLVARYIRGRQGIDVSRLARELPPE